ncbi:unnamed protein product [Hyaloperonospora brassicae]|uniref:Seipin n=1 Tax=Hyaloperonospora brassicae TaxID=162125 RepID=A0AAV0TVM7_HYABA|nr:unnamed protein product [Hyaloperonospora brassicae]
MTAARWSPWPLVLPFVPAAATALLQSEDERQRLRALLAQTAATHAKLALLWLVRAVQVGAGLAALVGSAAVLYALLYALVMPSRFHDQEVFFDYGPRHAAVTQPPDGCAVPSASLDLHDPVHQWQSLVGPTRATPAAVLVPGVTYDVMLELTLPESRANAEVGVFMVATSLWDAAQQTQLASSVRPLMLRDLPAPVRWVQLAWWLVPYALGVAEPVQTLRVMAINGYVESAAFPVTRVDIELNTPKVQVAAAKLTVIAQLTGVRYLMYHWAVPTAALFILNIAFVELVVLVVLYAVYVLPQLDGDAADVTVLEVAAADAAVLEAAAIEARDKAKQMGEKQAAAKAAETDVAAKSEGLSGGTSCVDEGVHESSTDGAKSFKEEEMGAKEERVDELF